MANFISLTIAKEGGNTLSATRTQLFDPQRMANVKASGTAVSFDYYAAPSVAPVSAVTFVTGALTLTQLLNQINTSAPAGSQAFIGVLDTSVSGSASIGAHDLLDINGNAITLPANTRIWDSYYEVTTTFTSSTDAATISFGVATDAATGLKAATAISTGTTYDAVAAPVAFTPVGTVGTATTKTTAARKVQYTVASEALTAGKLYCYLYAVTGV